ncbi:MAG: hypothetical protein J5782_00025 [Clostridia bacterium]|nr:hypothetical protein [Clostridia bacterium]
MNILKKILCILLCILFMISLSVPAFAANNDEKETNEKVISFSKPNGRVMSVAKYGNVRQFPANSLEGIVNSIDLGIDIITVSVRVTKDDQFVLLTSSDLSKVCCGNEGVAVAGRAEEYTLEDLQNTFFLKSGYGGSDAEATTYKIASLLDAIAAADGKALLMINNGWKYAEEINKLAQEKDCADMIILRGATSVDEISAFKTKYGTSSCLVAASYNADTSDGSAKSFVEQALAAGAYMVELGGKKPGANVFKQSVLENFKNTGRAFVSTTDESLCGGREDRQAAWSDLIERGFSVIETDYPRELANYLKEIETYRTELTTLITKAQGIEKERYTKASVKALDEALEEAMAVTAKGNAALDEIDTARYHIQESLDGLVIATGDEKTVLPTWLVVVIIAAAILLVAGGGFFLSRALKKAHKKKIRFERFKKTFKSEIPVENDESLKTNIAEDPESLMGIDFEPEPDHEPEEAVPEVTEEPAVEEIPEEETTETAVAEETEENKTEE